MENIIQSIQELYPIREAAMEAFTGCLEELEYPKNSILIEGGKYCPYYYFIAQGICRSYSFVNGEEVTSWFSREGDFTFALNSAYHKQAGFEYVQVLEPSLIYAISIEDMNALYEEHIDWANWSRTVHQECVLQLQLRRIERLQMTAEDRYNTLLKEQPDLFQRVKQGHLASFLGMTPSYLSTLRKK